MMATVITYNGGQAYNVSGKIVLERPNGIVIEDSREIRYYATFDRVVSREGAQADETSSTITGPSYMADLWSGLTKH